MVRYDVAAFIGQVTLPRNDTFAPQLDGSRAGIARPEVQARVAKLLQMGFNQASDLEHHLGRDIVLTGAPTDIGAPL